MWVRNKNSYKNGRGQEVVLSYRPTESRDWKYEDRTYQHIYEVRLETEWGNRFFWYCFAEPEYEQEALRVAFLEGEESAFEPIRPYLQGDISQGLELGAILPNAAGGVLVFGKAS